MMFGGNFQEVLQNAVLLNLPDWFTKGLASYMGENWNADMEDQLRDGILSGKYKKLNKLNGDEVRFVGHAMWHYVEEKYGKAAVSNLLYLTRINRSMESGFLFVLGGSVKSVYTEWYNTQLARFKEQQEKHIMPIDSNKVAKKAYKLKEHYQVKLDGDGKQLAYVTNILGLYKVYVHDNETHKQKRILKGGHKTITLVTDLQYPLLAWSPDKKNLAVIYNRRDKLKLLLYNTEKKKKVKADITKFQQIHDFRFTNDPGMLVMSAVNKGQSDIYTYQINNTTTQQLTDDYYDDLNAAYVDADGRKGVMFSSNRPGTTLTNTKLDTTLLKSDFDIYFLNMAKGGKELTQITNTDFTNETSPMQYDSSNICYLSDINGINNRYVGHFEEVLAGHDTIVYLKDSIAINPKWNVDSLKAADASAVDSIKVRDRMVDVVNAYPITDNAESIIEQDVNRQAQKSIALYREKGRYNFYIDTLVSNPTLASAQTLTTTPFEEHYLKMKEKERAVREAKKAEAAKQAEKQVTETDTTDAKDYFFQSDYNTAPEINVAHGVGSSDEEAPAPVFMTTRVRPYTVKFATDYIVTQVDNTLLMTRYEPFQPGVPVFNNPDLGAMIKLGMSDLFEDHKVYGGFRLPFSFQGSEYFLAYENLKKRLDWRIMYYRRVDQQSYGNDQTLPYYGQLPPAGRPANLAVEAKQRTNYFEARLKYAIDVTKSIRWYLAYRNDNFVYQANEDFTLNLPNYSQNWVSAKVEYVQDNTIKIAKNLYNGVRFKVWGELNKHFTIQKDTILHNIKVPLPNFDSAYFGVLAMDFRYYQKIHRSITWCNRVAIGTSFGNNKVIYYLGGVDNWIAAQYNQETPVNQNNGYAYQTTATNLRGFDQNIRNGNTYAVFNSELRWPIFSYFINSNIKSEFLRDFMLVGFTDIGSAWEGLNPFDNNNPLFTEHYTNGSVTANVKYYRNPIVVGYGFGVRSSLFGYYMRFDVAWGKDSGQKVGPKLYFSLSTDF